MHGCGNDYIYVNTMEYEVADPQSAAIAWSDRHKGIGSDGLVLIGKSPVPEADYTMHIYNADGSEAMMCGNASRCIGKYLYERGLTTETEIRLLTLSGVKILQLHIINNKVESVTVDMLEPAFEDENQFLANRGVSKGVFVSMGNPHAVYFVDSLDRVENLDLEKFGPAYEHFEAFPARVNSEFVHVINKEHARMRVWERGSGETWACGTGACATLVACVLNGKTDRRITLDLNGGSLDLAWDEATNCVFMTGPATEVFEGAFEY